ncbi:MAG: SGNH/GDSL hydrolase family protein [Pelagimonas sp.]|jgi:lysophospholipase L1-like esterase|nr:SGNH/GDSL hydrolase family protein [Pelagimonas sp.]
MFDQILRIPLIPLLAYQALQVRKTALKLPEATGPRSGRLGSGPPLRLLILGDSAGAGVGVDQQDQALSGQLSARLAQDYDVSWTLEATTGHTTQNAIKRLDNITGAFDVVMTSLGVNDVTRGVSQRRFIQQQSQLVARLSAEFHARLIILSAVPDMALFPALPHPLRWVLGQQSRRLDRGVAQVAQALPQVRHLRPEFEPDPSFVARDGYHPSAQAYALWAEMLAREIRDHFPARI